MAKSKKGLKLAEVVLIIETIIGLLAGFTVLLLGSSGSASALDNIFRSLQYVLFTVSFSAVNLGGFVLSASGIVLAIFAYINLLILIALIASIAKSKMSRHLIALIGYLIGFIIALCAAGFFLIIARPILGKISLVKKLLVVGLLIVVFLVYVMALFCAIAAFVGSKKDVANRAKEKENQKESDERRARIEERRERIRALERRLAVLEAALMNGQVVAAPAKKEEVKEEEPEEEPQPEPLPEVEEDEEKEVIERIPFTTKLSKSEKDIKDKYNELKAYLLSFGVKSRVSVSGDTFRLHKKTYAIIAVAGKHLKVYLPLELKEYQNSTIPVVDASHFKKYQDTPVAINVRSDLSVRRAKILISDVMHQASLEQGEVVEKNYASQAIKAAKAK